jgi:hypothetical protein
MADSPKPPPLIPLHPDSALNAAKLAQMERLSTETLRVSLLPGLEGSLKTRPDGTILDRHPETDEQRDWIDRYAVALAGMK